MLRKLRPHLTFANVASGLALFLVLTGGTAMAVDGSLPGQDTVGTLDIINGEVTGDDLKADSIGSTKIINGQVKNQDLGAGASNTNTIQDAGVWGVDVKDGSLDGDDVANDSLTGADIDESTLADLVAPPEDWVAVDPATEGLDRCVAESGVFCTPGAVWRNYGSGLATAAFYKDPFGVVHLKGVVQLSNLSGVYNEDLHQSTILRLPVGYRPETRRIFPTVGESLGTPNVQVAPGRVDVAPDGSVVLIRDCAGPATGCSATGEDVTLEAISFRAEE